METEFEQLVHDSGMAVRLNVKALRAVSLLAADDGYRYFLKGVFIEADAMQTRMVASNN